MLANTEVSFPDALVVVALILFIICCLVWLVRR